MPRDIQESKQYLETTVNPVLTQALFQMCVAEPDDPFTWLAQWLIENHPTRPSKAEWSETLVLKLSAGDFFGEIALLSGKPRQATVRAVGAVAVLVLSRDAFTRLCGNLFDILHRNMSKYSTMELHMPDDDDEDQPSGAADAEEEEEPQEEEEEEEEEEPAAAAAPPLKTRQRSRRSNVFVEAVEIESDWEPPSYSKTDEERGRLEVYISKTALLAYLDTKAKATVLDAFQKKTFVKDENIITQGDDGDYYYILDAGHADVWLRKPPAGPEAKVFEYTAGGAFGELALLHGEPRLASVRATEDCVTWALDRDTFRKIMMSTGKQNMNDRTQFLSKVSLLEELTLFERFKIAEAMEVRNLMEGETIVAEGEAGAEFFIIQSGACSCFKKTLKF